jgi:hypothetical protein
MYYCHSLVFVISLLFGCAVGFSPTWLRSATSRHSSALGKQNTLLPGMPSLLNVHSPLYRSQKGYEGADKRQGSVKWAIGS